MKADAVRMAASTPTDTPPIPERSIGDRLHNVLELGN
jgi:hypothetical protein